MAYEIVIADERLWRKDCGRIPHDQLSQILQKIRSLAHDPWAGGVHVKQLKHYNLADYRLQVGNFRVLFNKNEESRVISLLRVLHRSKLY